MQDHQRTSRLLGFIALCGFAFQVIAPGGIAGQVAPSPSVIVHPPVVFERHQRVNFSGDEYNAIAKSPDGKHLFVATEKGDVIVWDITGRRVERRLNQGQPAHLVVALADSNFIVSAGSRHDDDTVSGVVRKWNINSGTYEDLAGFGTNFYPISIAADNRTGLVAVGSAEGRIVVWDAQTSKILARTEIGRAPLALTLIGREVYFAGVRREDLTQDAKTPQSLLAKFNVDAPATPQEFAVLPGWVVSSFEPSPDGQRICAVASDEHTEKINVLDRASGKEISVLKGESAIWLDRDRLLAFDGLDPSRTSQISGDGTVVVTATFEHIGRSFTHGRAFGLQGAVVANDGNRVWSVYEKGGWLIEWDLQKATGTLLLNELTGGIALSVRSRPDGSGVVLTGGNDGYLRLWDVRDLTLRKELLAAPEGRLIDRAELLPDGQTVIATVTAARPLVGSEADPVQPTSLTEVIAVNMATGEKRTLLSIKGPAPDLELIGNDFLYSSAGKIVLASGETGASQREFVAPESFSNWAVSANQQWMIGCSDTGTMYQFDLASGKIVSTIKMGINSWTPLAISNSGRFVYAVQGTTLVRWDVTASTIVRYTLKDLVNSQTLTHLIRLTDDDSRLVTEGNESDVGVVDAHDGHVIFYRNFSEDAAFNIENVWLKDGRLIFITDTGVMIGGQLKE